MKDKNKLFRLLGVLSLLLIVAMALGACTPSAPDEVEPTEAMDEPTEAPDEGGGI